MRLPITANQDDIATFVVEGTHLLATISTNDYGFQQSAQMAQSYLERAILALESKYPFDRLMQNEINALKTLARAIAEEYAQLEKFREERERFNRLAAKDIVEWLSKGVVRAWSRGHLATVSHHLAHKIRTFHSRVSWVLMER
jgi:predicted NodU family carbamoyl transferase